ncbi:hypothetical protein M011DRAFT_394139 [Sporormia fimetaria CBS 119925]|uniref:Uncharacterized protein n=1 Tax=Sporormia fimetaria CBS 119925 TaxID=1340428 RepID=A0A6A6VN07_9PLEO|nr:hypothetical protein M011DRAFT_394139 [Sporormia fimetaria CBS 119925]
MRAASHHHSPSLHSDNDFSSPTCYFSYVPNPSATYSAETPHSPLAHYEPNISPDPVNPLLALRFPSLSACPPAAMDAAKVLQLQTAAAHPDRPDPKPLQSAGLSPSSSTSSTTSVDSTCSADSSMQSLPTQSTCSRCRRSGFRQTSMIRFGTNLYYCSHCASMTGYSAG